MKRCGLIFLPLLLLCAAGCGSFVARRMAQAPNTYPEWLAPEVSVSLDFNPQLLTVFPNQYLQIDSPAARIRYRVIEPADYQFNWTNQIEATGHYQFSFNASVNLPQRTNQWTHQPRGVAVLLHGYGVSGYAMLPWAFHLAQDGWRCVLVDLRGHGKSNGRQIYFGIQEVRDLQALLDELRKSGGVTSPVAVVGHSYGAVLALRWRMSDPRVDKVVAMSPYADISSAVLNISAQYARWIPTRLIKAGLRKLPDFLHVQPEDLNPSSWTELNRQAALFIAGGEDRIVPVDQVERLSQSGNPNNRLIVVPKAAHEPLPFYFDDLAGPVARWLSGNQFSDSEKARSAAEGAH
jgi:alpha-beta hydrolase superfamily lysophospholipase